MKTIGCSLEIIRFFQKIMGNAQSILVFSSWKPVNFGMEFIVFSKEFMLFTQDFLWKQAVGFWTKNAKGFFQNFDSIFHKNMIFFCILFWINQRILIEKTLEFCREKKRGFLPCSLTGSSLADEFRQSSDSVGRAISSAREKHVFSTGCLNHESLEFKNHTRDRPQCIHLYYM